jgi:hypothetical protein
MRPQQTVSKLTEEDFDSRLDQLTALVDDWGDRECTSFDDAVLKASGQPASSGGSLWDIPMIDSKRVVSLLTELEPVLDVRLPATLIKAGGYSSVQELKDDLLPRIKKHAMSDKARLLPNAATAAPSPARVAVNINTQASP